jgi:hypothetical protein
MWSLAMTANMDWTRKVPELRTVRLGRRQPELRTVRLDRRQTGCSRY